MNVSIRRQIALTLLIVTAVAGQAPVRVRGESSKPMMDMCTQIADLFQWRITYEDAPLMNPDEVHQERSPSGLPWTKMNAVPVSLDIPPMGHEPLIDYRRRVMDLAIGAYAASGNRAAFASDVDGEYIHVTPSAVRGADGVLRPFQSILNTRVSIPRGRYSLGQVVSSVIAQVGNQVGTRIAMATVPNNIFAFAMITEEANNEPANEVLMRAFDEVNGPRYAAGVPPMRMSWDLMYMADGPPYFFNVHGEQPELDEATVAQRSRTGEAPSPSAQPSSDPAKVGFVGVSKP
jgi:hypothetical protein